MSGNGCYGKFRPTFASNTARLRSPSLLIKAAVKLFDRQDGEGVDWRMTAEILFFAAFDALDRLPDD